VAIVSVVFPFLFIVDGLRGTKADSREEETRRDNRAPYTSNGFKRAFSYQSHGTEVTRSFPGGLKNFCARGKTAG
jgi:hypothetical protein